MKTELNLEPIKARLQLAREVQKELFERGGAMSEIHIKQMDDIESLLAVVEFSRQQFEVNLPKMEERTACDCQHCVGECWCDY